MSKQKGFTLIELLVVITIIGILAAVGVVSYKTVNQKARNTRRLADMQQIASALEMYRDEQNHYPVSPLANDANFTKFMPNGVPKDPKSNNAYSYMNEANCYSPTGSVNTSIYCVLYLIEGNPDSAGQIKNP